jgi:hypothetical protein
MTQKECVALLVPLALAMQTEFDGPTQRAYFRALADVPVRLLAAAVDRVGKSGARFFPKVTELRRFADEARAALLAAHPFVACAECQGTGWDTVLDADGVSRVRRCQCWEAHQVKIADLGVGQRPLALPEPEPVS